VPGLKEGKEAVPGRSRLAAREAGRSVGHNPHNSHEYEDEVDTFEHALVDRGRHNVLRQVWEKEAVVNGSGHGGDCCGTRDEEELRMGESEVSSDPSYYHVGAGYVSPYGVAQPSSCVASAMTTRDGGNLRCRPAVVANGAGHTKVRL
jgi:hypothetical protein